MSTTYAMYIILNSDLGMRKGKLCSQAAHVAEELTARAYRTGFNKDPVYLRWKKEGSTKIVLRATQTELENLCKDVRSAFIYDEGLTQVPHHSLTAVAFPPGTDRDFSKYKLL